VAILVLILSAFAGGGISLYISVISAPSGHHLQLIVVLTAVVLCIIGCGIVVFYQIRVRKALHNQNEAQKIAKLGSWERDLETGRGYWSENRYRLFGLKPKRYAPSPDEFYSLLHPDDRERVKQTVSEALKGAEHYEVSYRLAEDPEKRIFVSRGTVVRDNAGKAVSVVGTSQDITEKVHQEEQNEALIAQKDLFISRLGHDLNTPLTPLVTLLPMIRNQLVDEKQLKRLLICIDSVEQIQNLVASSMQLARRFQPLKTPLDFTTFSLFKSVNDIIHDMTALLDSQKMTCKNLIDPSITIFADHGEVETLFTNLINNAIKFSPSASPIEIKAEQSGCSVTISVLDYGVGLEPEELQHIFEDFYKADPSRHELGSAGLGLSICRQIVLNHGGLITASSGGKGAGTTISFTLLAGDAI